MTPEITELLKKALALPAEARAALAASLLECREVVDPSARKNGTRKLHAELHSLIPVR
jgi:hypothetical protein